MSPGLTSELARECKWATSFALPITPDYLSGVYIAVLTSQSHAQAEKPFVVRDDARAAALVYISPAITYAAYSTTQTIPLQERRAPRADRVCTPRRAQQHHGNQQANQPFVSLLTGRSHGRTASHSSPRSNRR